MLPWLSLVAARGGCSLVAVRGRLLAVLSLVEERGLQTEVSVVVVHAIIYQTARGLRC